MLYDDEGEARWHFGGTQHFAQSFQATSGRAYADNGHGMSDIFLRQNGSLKCPKLERSENGNDQYGVFCSSSAKVSFA